LDANYLWSYLAGAAAIVAFVFLAGLVLLSSGRSPSVHRLPWLSLIEGQDGRLSTSKAQWAAWTALVAGSYAAIYVARQLKGLSAPIETIPGNLLLVLGFSSATMATAKGITTTYVAGGRVIKGPTPSVMAPSGVTATRVAGGLLTDDVGVVDLSKIQLLTWTAIAIGVYGFTAVRQISFVLSHGVSPMGPTGCGVSSGVTYLCTSNAGMPSIDGALMVLMGLSQGGYLGKKLVTFNDTQVTLSTLVPASQTPGHPVTIYGTNFGNAGPDSTVLLDGRQLPSNLLDPNAWTDTKITFTVPQQPPGGSTWRFPQRVAVGVVVEGQTAPIALQLTVVQS